jgi:LmbE family N-acetylglucosaminyl deacetylase
MISSSWLDPAAYPRLLPHVGRHKDAVYFGAARVAPLSVGEAEFLDRCDGTRTLAGAASGCNVSADFIASAARWMIWWPAPVAARANAAPRRPIERLVLSAHPEDAWLGMGGRMIAEAEEVSTLVQTVFQVYTGAHGASFRTTRELAMACADETITAAQLGGVACECFSIPEYEARRLHHMPDEAARELLQLRIADLLAELGPREVFAPAALDGDVDATLVFEAVLGLLGEGILEGNLHLYEDSPSTLGERQVDEFLLRFEGTLLDPWQYYREVSAALARTESLLDVFSCRLDVLRKHAALDGARRNAREGGSAGALAAERFWEISFAALE